MADDETEKDPEKESSPEEPPEKGPEKKLPRRVERALSRAREAVKKDAAQKQGRWLALFPVTMAVVMFLLVMPRAAPPEDIPMPAVDQRAFDAVVASDRARAAAARQTRLPNDVLAVGTAIRAINKASVANDLDAYTRARVELDESVRTVLNRADGPSDLTTLRAVQIEEYLAELARFEDKGEVTPALDELAGPFLPRLRDAEWVEGSHILLDENERRVSYKLVWNTIAAVRGMDLALDETRVLYRLYLTHPHAPEIQRPGLQAQRGAARTPADCERYERDARRAAELWRADKIRLLGAVDPTYPTSYALGVAFYRAGRHEAAIDAFRAWLDAHPDGKWTARARNNLKATLAAYGSI